MQPLQQGISLIKGLNVHKTTHTYVFKCSSCNEEFKSAAELRMYKKTHAEHKCDVCGKLLAGSSGLIRHKRTHTGEKPYKCDVCKQGRNLGLNIGGCELILPNKRAWLKMPRPH